jgi:hypothetical protein
MLSREIFNDFFSSLWRMFFAFSSLAWLGKNVLAGILIENNNNLGN